MKRDKCALVVVDYAQLLTAKGKDEVERNVKIAMRMRQIAKDFCPVLAVAQMPIPPEHNINRRPTMLDIKGSSQDTQDAHVILMLYRPKPSTDELQAARNRGMSLEPKDEILIEKQREGAGGSEPVFQDEFGCFRPRVLPGHAE